MSMQNSLSRDLLSLLGLYSQDEQIVQMLDALGSARRPWLDEEDENVMIDWILVRRRGIEFGFEDNAYFNALDPSLRRKGYLLLTNIIFYNWPKSGIQPYSGALPWGLKFSDNRSMVRNKLAAFDAGRRSYVRDVYDLPEYRLIVSYSEDEQSITDVICKLVPANWPPSDVPLLALPTLNQMIELFGASPRSGRFVEVFQPLGIENHFEELVKERSMDLRLDFGLELYFQSSRQLAVERKDRGLVFAAVKFYRDRELDARGWAGELPFDLKFEDSPEILFKKVSMQPAKKTEDDTSGYVLWHSKSFSLHVFYSTYENLIYLIYLMAPGYWESITPGT